MQTRDLPYFAIVLWEYSDGQHGPSWDCTFDIPYVCVQYCSTTVPQDAPYSIELGCVLLDGYKLWCDNYIIYVYYVSIYWFLWTGNASTGAINISKTSVWNHLCSNMLKQRLSSHSQRDGNSFSHPTHCSKLSSLCQDVIQFKDEVQAAEIPKNLTDGLWKSIVICCVSVVASLASLASCVSPLWRPF